MSSDNASSAVTYTSISSDSNGLSWGIPLVNAGELSKMDPYEEVTQQGSRISLMLMMLPRLLNKPEDDDEDPEEEYHKEQEQEE
ncbi:hypothetical protein Tco_0663767 [Tanacetum coccineum]